MDFETYKEKSSKLEKELNDLLVEFIETYKEKSSKLEKELNDLLVEFIESNNPHKIGDVVSDMYGSILIQDILMDRCSGTLTKQPCAVYCGIILNKNGKPNKKGETRRIWQNKMKK